MVEFLKILVIYEKINLSDFESTSDFLINFFKIATTKGMLINILSLRTEKCLDLIKLIFPKMMSNKKFKLKTFHLFFQNLLNVTLFNSTPSKKSQIQNTIKELLKEFIKTKAPKSADDFDYSKHCKETFNIDV